MTKQDLAVRSSSRKMKSGLPLRPTLVSLAIVQTLCAPSAQAATITVNNRFDFDTNCTLRDAVKSINNAALEPGCSNSGAGWGIDDTIVFSESDIQLSSFALPIIQSMTIDGGAGTSISGDGNDRLIDIDGALGTSVTVNLEHLTLSGGSITGNGGAIYVEQANLNLLDCTIAGNTAINGGAITAFSSSIIDINDCTISDNSVVIGGGGILTQSSTISLTNSTVSGNSSTKGSGIYASFSSVANLDNATISKNSASQYGGGIYATSSATINLANNSSISENSAFLKGGGIYATTSSSVNLNNSSVSKNISLLRGGGIFANENAFVNLDNSSVSENATAEVGGGAYLYSADLQLKQSTISANTAGTNGGGIYSAFNTNNLSNCTISGNSAGNNVGGFYSLFSTTTNIINCTIASNSASGYGAGLAGYGTILTLSNSIVANSVGASDCFNTAGTINADDHNIIEDGSCGTNAATVDPELGPLANNGGATLTHALLPGSPAIDAGDNAICAAAPINNKDQRDKVRPAGSACDIGAYEFIDEGSFFVVPLANGKAVIFSL